MLGNVKRFNQYKGFGFITGEDGKDYFFHFSEIIMDGFKTVNEGEKVEFTPTQTERGAQAHNIQAVLEG